MGQGAVLRRARGWGYREKGDFHPGVRSGGTGVSPGNCRMCLEKPPEGNQGDKTAGALESQLDNSGNTEAGVDLYPTLPSPPPSLFILIPTPDTALGSCSPNLPLRFWEGTHCVLFFSTRNI